MVEEIVGNEIVYDPPTVGRYTIEEIERRRAHKGAGIKLGLGRIDSKLRPVRPGELIVLLGRPSHYKSGFAQWWARHLATDCLTQEREDVVAYVTTEMAIEELGIYDLVTTTKLDADRVMDATTLTDAEMATLGGAATLRGALPLWLIGHSLARRRKRVKLDMFNVEKALYWIEDNMQFRPRIVFIDYLNLLQSSRQPGQRPAENRRVDVSELVGAAKDMALMLGCPVVLLAQAKRECDLRDWCLPQMADGMESAAIEQYSDKVFSVWYPKVNKPLGSQIDDQAGGKLDVTNNLLILGLLKQKNGPAGGYWPLYVDPERNEIHELETEGVPF